ncbi:MAG: hypothetical protein VB111_04055 [Clostridiaceae bacterium]|nr:hypothetical protein [Clostridiaceae bacterium]
MDVRKDIPDGEPEIAYEKLFRNAMFGFSKEDVLAYLERMARSRRKESERYASHIRNLEASCESLKQELNALRAGNSVEPISAPMSVDSGVLTAENEALKSENEMLKLRLEELENAVQHDAEKPIEPEKPAASFFAERPLKIMKLVEYIDPKNPPKDAPQDPPAEPATPVEHVFDETPSTPPERNAEIVELTQKLDEAARERHVLEEKLRTYELEKARLAEIEETAHAHARAIEAQAQDKSSEMRAQVAAEVAALRAMLNELSARIDDTSKMIYAELSSSGTRYSALRRSTDELRTMLERF